MKEVLEYIDRELEQVHLGRSEYEDGYVAALNIIKRFIESLRDEQEVRTTKT